MTTVSTSYSWKLGIFGVLAGERSAVIRALHLIEELGPYLGLHINFSKCELFSRNGNSHFPPVVESSLLPNMDILGVPIGDFVHCSRFIARPLCHQVSLPIPQRFGICSSRSILEVPILPCPSLRVLLSITCCHMTLTFCQSSIPSPKVQPAALQGFAFSIYLMLLRSIYPLLFVPLCVVWSTSWPVVELQFRCQSFWRVVLSLH